MRLSLATAALAAVVGCDLRAAPPRPVIYDPPASRWPRPPATSRLGTGAPRVAVAGAPIVAGPGAPSAPLAMTGLVGSRGAGPVEAALAGRDAAGAAIELIDVDGGVVRWRNRSAGLPPVAVLGDRVYAAGGERVIAIDRVTGQERARLAARWVAASDGPRPWAAVAVGGGLAMLDGDRVGAPAALPAGAARSDVVALCDADGRFALAWRDGQLARWDLGGPVVIVRWSVPAPQPRRVLCDAAPLVVVGAAEVRALGVDGAPAGGPRPAVDAWLDPRDPGRVELATAAGVERRTRDLATADRLVPVVIQRWLAARGTRRIGIGGDGDLVLLDGDRAAPLAAPAGQPAIVPGDRAFVTGPWRFPWVSQAQRPGRYRWPALDDAPPPTLVAPLPPLAPAPVAIDLPPARLAGPGVARAGGALAVAAVAIDPLDAERLYAVVLDDGPTATTGAGVAAFDLHADRWRWLAAAGCPPGTPVAFAVVGPVVACAAHGPVGGDGAVRAVVADSGAPAWSWRGDTVDSVLGAGSVVAILAGAEVTLVDAASGAALAWWRTSDGLIGRVAVAVQEHDTRVASYEHGALVVRSRALGFLPIGAAAIDGAVAAVFTVGDRFAVALTDGSLYLVTDDGVATSAGALAGGWLPRGDAAVAAWPTGDRGAAVLAVDARGVPRAVVAVPGRVAALGSRAAVRHAPLAVVTADAEAVVIDDAGGPLARVDLPDVGALAFTTVVDGAPAAGVVVPQPLRVIRLAWP